MSSLCNQPREYGLDVAERFSEIYLEVLDHRSLRSDPVDEIYDLTDTMANQSHRVTVATVSDGFRGVKSGSGKRGPVSHLVRRLSLTCSERDVQIIVTPRRQVHGADGGIAV